MSTVDKIKHKIKEFGPSTWSIRNKTSIYLLIIFVSVIGVFQFITLPKEQFPDIVIPTIYIQTIYVGNSPKDIETLVTRPIEKQLKGITGAKINKITSTSLQDFSAIIVEYDTDVKTDVALQKTRDAVDKSKKDLPTDLTEDPNVQEVSFSEFPIMFVNVSGDFDRVKLKEWNMQLAESVYQTTKKKFEQGLGSSFEVLQSDNELQVAQSNYFSALYNAIIARIGYQSSLGKLE